MPCADRAVAARAESSPPPVSEIFSPAQIRDSMPFAALVGVELLQAGPELVRGRMAWAPERCTAGGLMHGAARVRRP